MALANIEYVKGQRPTDPDYGVEEPPPEIGNGLPPSLPPLVGIWPPPGHPNVTPPIAYPPGHHPMPPIFIDGSPENPIVLPPGIYPPLPPGVGSGGKIAVLVWVLGVGYRWAVVDTGVGIGGGPVVPPTAQPKR